MYGLSKDGLTLAEAAKFCGGTLFGDEKKKIYGVSTDSRKTGKNELFFALSGERFDGNLFVGAAAENGASCAVVTRKPDGTDIPYITVGDSKKALGMFAGKYYSLFSSLTVGVTGSVGKTSTKEFIYAVLSQKYAAAKTEGNFNNEIGLPLTLLSFNASYNALVLEMGMSAIGEISYLSELAKPDIAVITNIGSSHLENLGTRENIARAKLEITDGLKKNGVLIMNGDEPLLKNIKKLENKIIYAGVNDKNCDYLAYNIKEYADFILYDIRCPDGKTLKELKIPVIGIHNVMNSLYAVVTGILTDIGEDAIRAGLMAFSNCRRRGEIRKCGNITIIDDCYNASPESMRSSILTLCHVAKNNKGRKIAFLGDMRELGENSAIMHREVGAFAAEKGIDIIISFGSIAENIVSGAIENGFPKENAFVITDTDNTEEAEKTLLRILKDGDTVLFKASRSLKLERISEKIK